MRKDGDFLLRLMKLLMNVAQKDFIFFEKSEVYKMFIVRCSYCLHMI